jgi:hypothetical protein
MSELRFEPELEALVRQGGFSQSAWTHVATAIEEYREHRGLDSSTMVVTVELRNGERLPLMGIRAAFSYVVLLLEDDSMRLVPNAEVVGIDIRRRPGPAPERKPVGFSIEYIEGDEPTT